MQSTIVKGQNQRLNGTTKASLTCAKLERLFVVDSGTSPVALAVKREQHQWCGGSFGVSLATPRREMRGLWERVLVHRRVPTKEDATLINAGPDHEQISVFERRHRS